MTQIEMIQTEVRNIVLEVNVRGWKMNKPSMKKWNEMLALPHSDVIVAVLAERGNRPDTKCDAIVNEIIKLGNDAGGKIAIGGKIVDRHVDGESYITEASALYNALNFVEVTEEPTTANKEVSFEMLAMDSIEDENGNVVVKNLGGSTVQFVGNLPQGNYKFVRRNRILVGGYDWQITDGSWTTDFTV